MARKKGVPNVRNNGSRSRGGEESPPPVDLQLAPAQFPPQQQLAPPPPSAFAPQPVHTYYATPAPLPPPPVAPVYQRGAPRPVALPGESLQLRDELIILAHLFACGRLWEQISTIGALVYHPDWICLQRSINLSGCEMSMMGPSRTTFSARPPKRLG